MLEVDVQYWFSVTHACMDIYLTLLSHFTTALSISFTRTPFLKAFFFSISLTFMIL